jgi:hypothetical protein
MVTPLWAAAGCGPDSGSICSYCDGGKVDLREARPEDSPAAEAGLAGEAAGNAPDRPPETGDSRPPTLRDATPGEAPQPSPIPDAGYLLVDHFQTGSALGWEILPVKGPYPPTGDWSVILGTSGSVFSQGTLDADNWHIAYRAAAIGPDQIVEAKLRVVDFYAEAPSYVGAVFARYDSTTDSGYFLALRGDGSVSVRRRDSGASASWGAGVDMGIRPGVWYTVRLEVIGNAINAFIDGTPVYSVSDDSPLSGDGVALGTFGATLEVDSVSVAAP